MKKLLLILFLISTTVSFSQTIICGEYDLCVVEFNASFNETNKTEWLSELTDCGVKRISIDKGEWKAKFKIFAVPTIIIFNGEEVERFNPNIMMQVEATREDVQNAVDEILMESF